LEGNTCGSLLKFFSLTYVVNWSCFVAVAALSGTTASALSAGAGLRVLLLYVGIFAPSLVALGLTAQAEGLAGTRALLRRLLGWRVGARWYVFAVSYMAAIKLAAALVHHAVTGAWPRFGNEAWYVMAVAVVFSTPAQAGEEIGWRGYALPHLAQRFGLARASVLLGIIWACWHLPLFFFFPKVCPLLLPVDGEPGGTSGRYCHRHQPHDGGHHVLEIDAMLTTTQAFDKFRQRLELGETERDAGAWRLTG
jgi:membrane protease YdiL (CAAX protease family)